MLAVGAVSFAGGVALAVRAVGRQADALDLRDQQATRFLTTAERAEYNEALDERNQLRLGALILGAGGAALLAGGALLHAFDRPAVALLPRRTVEPGPRPAMPADLTSSSLRPHPLLGPGLYGAGVTAHF
jgi:hypothetical protein